MIIKTKKPISLQEIKNSNRKLGNNELILKSRKDDKNYCGSPPWLINGVRQVLGRIYTDPCTTEEMNRFICAKVIYTEKENGLNHPWYNEVWASIPYSNRLSSKFVNKAIEEWGSGNITSMLLLARLDVTNAFNKLVESCSAYGQFKKRFHHLINKKRVTKTSPNFGEVIFYFGDETNKFEYVFSEVCHLVLKGK